MLLMITITFWLCWVGEIIGAMIEPLRCLVNTISLSIRENLWLRKYFKRFDTL